MRTFYLAVASLFVLMAIEDALASKWFLLALDTFVLGLNICMLAVEICDPVRKS